MKLISESPTHFLIEHNGNQMQVPKQGLSANATNMINGMKQHFDMGGTVNPFVPSGGTASGIGGPDTGTGNTPLPSYPSTVANTAQNNANQPVNNSSKGYQTLPQSGINYGNPYLNTSNLTQNVGAAQLVNPTNAYQASNAIAHSQEGLAQQNLFQQQLAGLNGIGNEQSTYNQQQALSNQLAFNNGAGNQASVFQQQQSLANALQKQAAGTGINPVQNQLNENTGTNVANEAALMASQRGAGANAGLLARQAAQQGAATQQQAVGQAATLQAQQQLQGQQALQAQQSQMAGLANTQIGQQQAQQSALSNYALQQTGQQGSALNSYNQSLQGEQGQLLGFLGNQNEQNVQMQSNLNTASVAQAGGNNQILAQGAGGAASGIGAGLVALAAAAKGGEIGDPKLKKTFKLPPHLHEVAKIYHPGYASGGTVSAFPQMMKIGGKVPGKPQYSGDNKKNDVVPAMLSKGEIVIPNSVTQSQDPVKGAAQFVAAIEAKKGKGNPKEDFKNALQRAIAGRKNK